MQCMKGDIIKDNLIGAHCNDLKLLWPITLKSTITFYMMQTYTNTHTIMSEVSIPA